MYIAVNSAGRRLPPQRGVEAYCPVCAKEVLSRIGSIRAPHWAHKVTSDCTHGQGMTKWHYDWLGQFAELPGWDIEVSHDAFIFDAFNKTENAAIEFQRNPDLGYMKRKSTYAIEQNIRLFWLLGERALTSYQLRPDAYQAKSHGRRVLHELLLEFGHHDLIRFVAHDSRIKACREGAAVWLKPPAVTGSIVHASIKFDVTPITEFVDSLLQR